MREHLHHLDLTPGIDVPTHTECHATIVMQRWTDLHLNYILGASGTITPPTSFYIGLSTTAVSSLTRTSGASPISGITEIGITTPANYSRQAIARTIAQAGIDWGTSSFDSTLSTGGTSMAGDQVTFSFNATPNANGANSWFMTGAATINTDYGYVAADTAATRNFGNGDTEKVTPTIKSG